MKISLLLISFLLLGSSLIAQTLNPSIIINNEMVAAPNNETSFEQPTIISSMGALKNNKKLKSKADIAQYDASIISVLQPLGGCSLTANEVVSVYVANLGKETIQNIPIGFYYEKNNLLVLDTIKTQIAPKDKVLHVFSTHFDASTKGNYTLKFFTSLDNDTINTNDTLTYSFSNALNLSLFNINFENNDNVLDSFYVNNGKYGQIDIVPGLGTNKGNALRLWGKNGGEPAFALPNTWTNNVEHMASINFCIDATSLTTLRLSFNMRQTYYWVASFTAFRVLINDSAITPTYIPVTTHFDPYKTIIIDLTKYAGTQFKITFQAVNNFHPGLFDAWGNSTIIDNIKLEPIYNNDVSISNGKYSNSDYTIFPLSQKPSFFTFTAEVKNCGLTTMHNAKVKLNIEGIHGDSINISSISPNNTSNANLIRQFIPTTTDTFNLTFSVNTTEPDQNMSNNIFNNQLIISDSVYARDNGVNDGQISFVNNTWGFLGQTYSITNSDTVTSISFYLVDATIGDTLNCEIYSFANNKPSIFIAATHKIIVNKKTGWFTVPIENGGVILSPGKYIIGLNDSYTYASTLGYNQFNYGDSLLSWYRTKTTDWTPLKKIGYIITLMIRPNFGHNAVLLPDIKLNNASLTPKEYYITPLSQASNWVFNSTIYNNGRCTLKNILAKVEIDTIFSTSKNTASLGINEEKIIWFSKTFTATDTGHLTINYSVQIDTLDAITTNNTISLNYIISDTVYARDNGIVTGATSVSSGVLGQKFQIFNTDTITSVSFMLIKPFIKSPITVDLYSFTDKPGGVIASTEPLYSSTGDTAWYTLKFENGGVIVPPGQYFIGVNNVNKNSVNLASSKYNYYPDFSWYKTTGDWTKYESKNQNICFLLRINLGHNSHLTHDAKITSVKMQPGSFYKLPISQITPISFSSTVLNNGHFTIDTILNTVKVNNSFSDSIYIKSLDKGSSQIVNFSKTFTPYDTGKYTVDFAVKIDTLDGTPNNNFMTKEFFITDTVLAFENGKIENLLGINGKGILGQKFQIFNTDTLTSISFLCRPQIGDTLSVDIYKFTTEPTEIIGSTVKLYVTSSDTAWYTLVAENGGIILTPGTYFIGLNDSKTFLSGLFYSTYNYNPNCAWIKLGNSWTTMESQKYEITFMLRANFGKAKTNVKDIKAMSFAISDNEYFYTPLEQVPMFTFTGSMINNCLLPLTNVKAVVMANTHRIDSITTPLINPFEVKTLSFNKSFKPTQLGTYIPKLTLSINDTENNIENNELTAPSFVITDSVLARDNGVCALPLGINGSGILGGKFTLINADTLTSVSFYLNKAAIGDSARIGIFNFTTSPSTYIGRTEKVIITNDTACWYTAKVLNKGLLLQPGSYLIGIYDNISNNINVGTSDYGFVNNTQWIYSNATWNPLESYGSNYLKTLMIRPNFGHNSGFSIGIDQPNNEPFSINVFPNPSNNYLHIECSAPINSIKIYNYIGECIYSENANNTNIRLVTSNINSGLYLIQIHTNKGFAVRTISVVH